MASNKTLKAGVSVQSSKDAQIQKGVFSFSEGPLPEPAILSEYEKIHPGVTTILLDELQREGEARRYAGKLMAWSAVLAPFAAVLVFFVIGYFSVELAKVNANFGSATLMLFGAALVIAVIKGTLKKIKIEKSGLEVTQK